MLYERLHHRISRTPMRSVLCAGAVGIGALTQALWPTPAHGNHSGFPDPAAERTHHAPLSTSSAPADALPTPYEIPAEASQEARTAIRWALGQVGTLYQWGGTCTDPHGPDPQKRCDCSSLTQQAYAAAGVPLTRTTYTQVGEGHPVSAQELQPGDLLFTRGTPQVPEHVGLFVGNGLVVHAPGRGKTVRVDPVATWQPNILTARRIVN
ncbi:C40 family peptidase [Streptomyces pathocidini]|uniref:C40 family peptidase n=1 Tax=Streptomyces pathocidini TaxID=1650571 RepID=A0ABW7UP43_9ACTN